MFQQLTLRANIKVSVTLHTLDITVGKIMVLLLTQRSVRMFSIVFPTYWIKTDWQTHPCVMLSNNWKWVIMLNQQLPHITNTAIFNGRLLYWIMIWKGFPVTLPTPAIPLSDLIHMIPCSSWLLKRRKWKVAAEDLIRPLSQQQSSALLTFMT